MMDKAQIKDYGSKFQYDKDYQKDEKDQKRQARIKSLQQEDNPGIQAPDLPDLGQIGEESSDDEDYVNQCMELQKMHKGTYFTGPDAKGNQQFNQIMDSNKMKQQLAKQMLEGIFEGNRHDDEFDIEEKRFELVKLISLLSQLQKR